MRTGLALFCRAAIADLRFDRNERRMLFIRLRFLYGTGNRRQVIAILYGDRLEAKCRHALLDIFRKRNIRASLNRYLIAVIENDKLGKAQCACQGESFRGNSFHHAAIAAQRKGIMIYHREIRLIENRCQVSFRHSHAHGHALLPEPGQAGRRISF